MDHIERKRSRRRRPRRAAYIMGISICFLAAAAGVGTVTFAKYLSGTESGWFQILPENFYFTSDLLKPRAEEVIELYNWNQEEDYVFFMDIRNWKDDLRFNQNRIVYSVETAGADGIAHSVVLPGNVTQSQENYELPGNLITTQKLVITVPRGVTPAGNQVKVTVKAKPKDGIGYTKSLTGTFKLNEGTETMKHEVEVHKAYIDLLIGVDKGQTLHITWPSSLTPDNTNKWLKEAVGTAGDVTLEEKSSCRLRFFITGDLGAGDTFTVNGKPVTIS